MLQQAVYEIPAYMLHWGASESVAKSLIFDTTNNPAQRFLLLRIGQWRTAAPGQELPFDVQSKI